MAFQQGFSLEARLSIEQKKWWHPSHLQGTFPILTKKVAAATKRKEPFARPYTAQFLQQICFEWSRSFRFTSFSTRESGRLR